MGEHSDLCDTILAALGEAASTGVTVDDIIEIAQLELRLDDRRLAVAPALDAILVLAGRGSIELLGGRVTEYRVRLPLGELVV